MKLKDDDSRLRWISFEEATKPKDGYVVMTNKWWVTHPEKGLCFYVPRGRHYWHAQCNSVEEITRKIAPALFRDWAEPKFIPIAYVPPQQEDY